MSYVNQDPDIIVPFKAAHVVGRTRNAWLVDMANANCWCGCEPGSCVDCKEDQVNAMMGKMHIGSGEDADMFR